SATCPPDAFQPDGTSCSDSVFCNGAETCASGVCQNGSAPCTGGQSCDEATAVCFTGQCPSNAVACRTAEESILVVQGKADDTKDKLIWKWIKGASTLTSEFADPTSTANYALCFYSGPSEMLIGSADVPASASWTPLGAKGFKYQDPSGASSGIQKIILKASL